MKKSTGLIFFALGVIAGLLGNLGARKVKNMQILPDNLFEDADWED